jgi:2,3-bisphosphoglycerate-dependent phosphoglycerate mutase
MARLYLIRHAQSANNAIWNGDDHGEGRMPDPEITETGHQQAVKLGEFLAHPEAEPRQHPFKPGNTASFNLSHVYCSLMTRSILTAEYITNACGLELNAHADLFEKEGIYDVAEDGQLRGLPGQDRSYFENRFPQLKLPENLNDDGWWSRPAEDLSSFLGRMKSVVEQFRQQHADSDDCIAMVAHGDFIDQFINELMGVDRHDSNYRNDWVANWTFHNTSISRFDFLNGSSSAVYLNRIDHLPADLITW